MTERRERKKKMERNESKSGEKSEKCWKAGRRGKRTARVALNEERSWSYAVHFLLPLIQREGMSERNRGRERET